MMVMVYVSVVFHNDAAKVIIQEKFRNPVINFFKKF